MQFAVLFTIISTLVIMSEATTTYSDPATEFGKFKESFGKKYENEGEEQRRLTIFSENLSKIVEHNKKYERGEVTFTMGINQFADLTPDEMSRFHMGLKPQKRNE